MNLKLERFAYHPAGTLGRLRLPDGTVLFTVERSWHGNKPFNSCIPEGVYDLWPYNSRKFPGCYQVMNVPERTHILFHEGNYPADVQGCISPGERLLEGELGVVNSRYAMDKLRDVLGAGEHVLEITHFSPDYP